MTNRKAILISLVVPVIYSALFLRAMDKGDMSEKGLYILLSFAIWAASLLVAAILAVIFTGIFKKPKTEPWLYLATQLILPLTLVGYLIKSNIDQARHQRDFGNVDDNHSLLAIGRPKFGGRMDSLDARMLPVQTAFLKLESSLSNPNSILLKRYKSYWQDTLIGEHYDTVHIVYFDYLKGTEENYARLTVLGNTAVIDSLNVPGRVGVFPARHLDVKGASLFR